MLQQIHAKNFQNHTNSTLELTDGVNVVSGDSDGGKTAIASRVPNLIINNRPSSYPYRPWSMKKKDQTIAKFVFDDGTVTRIKSDTIDKYILEINGQDPQEFSSLNRQVPDEVKRFLNLAEYSYQAQEDRHFFISESASTRAAMLNDISGLSIIDTSLSNINSKIKENTTKQKQLDSDITNLTSKIDKLKFIDKADELLVHLESLSTENEQLDLVNKNLEIYLSENEQIDNKIKELSPILNCKDKASSLRSLIEEYKSTTEHLNALQEYVNKISELDSIIESNKVFIVAKDNVIDLKNKIQEQTELQNNYDNLLTYSNSLNDVEGVIESTKVWLTCKEKCDKLTKIISEHGFTECDIEDLENWIENIKVNNDKVIELRDRVKLYKQKKSDLLVRDGKCVLCGSDIG